MELVDIVLKDGLKPANCIGYIGDLGKISPHVYYREEKQHPKSHGICEVCKTFYLAEIKIKYKKND